MKHGQISLHGPTQPAEPDVALWEWADARASNRYYDDSRGLRPVDYWTKKAEVENYD
jgi:hypothetical protein